MADLKGQEIRNAYDELLTKGAGNTVEDGDGAAFDIFDRAFTAGGLVRLPSGLNFNASGGDTLSDYEVGTWTPISFSGTFDGTVNSASGTYTRIGREVTYTFVLNSTSGIFFISTGRFLVMSGLPFTSSTILCNGSVSANRDQGVSGWVRNVASTTTLEVFSIIGGATVLRLTGTVKVIL